MILGKGHHVVLFLVVGNQGEPIFLRQWNSRPHVQSFDAHSQISAREKERDWPIVAEDCRKISSTGVAWAGERRFRVSGRTRWRRLGEQPGQP